MNETLVRELANRAELCRLGALAARKAYDQKRKDDKKSVELPFLFEEWEAKVEYWHSACIDVVRAVRGEPVSELDS